MFPFLVQVIISIIVANLIHVKLIKLIQVPWLSQLLNQHFSLKNS